MVAKITPTIEIDTDKPCSTCGKTGSTAQGGICLECAGKRISEQLKWKIGEKTVLACVDILQSLLWEYHSEINRAYTLTPGELAINMNLKITPDGSTNSIKGGISFTIEKTKGECDPVFVDEKQLDLGLKE